MMNKVFTVAATLVAVASAAPAGEVPRAICVVAPVDETPPSASISAPGVQTTSDPLGGVLPSIGLPVISASVSVGVNLPSIGLPSIGLPSIGLPSLSVPPVALPSLSVPPIGLPSLSVPPVVLPSLSIPPVGLPSLSVPPVDLPSLSIPPVGLPSLSLPPIGLPSLSVPPVGLPSLSLPVVSASVSVGVDVPPIGLPSIGLPSIGLPSLSVPPVVLPSLSVPPVGLPSLSVPPVGLPSLSVPPVVLPSLSVPPVGLPSLSVPPVVLPSLSIPPVGLPSLSIPPIGLPSLSVPPVIQPSSSRASAAPSATPSLSAQSQIATFENAVGIPLVALSPISTYQGLNWDGFSLGKTGGLQSLAIVKPNTPDNLATFGGLTRLQSASMLSNYPGSTVDHFDLESFYYGCALSTVVSVLGVPTTCTITVKGYSDDAGTQLVATQEFCYTVGLLNLSTQMVKATLPTTFKNLKKVSYSVTNPLLTAGLIDTVAYKVYNK